jgi:hypothetical protein
MSDADDVGLLLYSAEKMSHFCNYVQLDLCNCCSPADAHAHNAPRIMEAAAKRRKKIRGCTLSLSLHDDALTAT